MKQYKIYLICLIGLFLCSCLEKMTSVETPIVPTLADGPPVATSSPTPQYPATLEYAIQRQFYDVLASNGNCELPCVWGVMPGKTSLKDAMDIIGKYTLIQKFSPYMLSGSQPRYEYSNVVDVSIKIDIHTYVEIDTLGDKVRGLSLLFSLSESGYGTLADENFEIYSMLTLFSNHGAPDYVYLNPPKVSQSPESYSIYVFYEGSKIMLSYNGTSTEVGPHVYQLCPNIGDGDIGNLHLVTVDPSDPKIHIVPYGRDDFSLESSVPITTLVELPPMDLYNLFVNDNTYCFLYDRDQEVVIYR